MGKGKPRGGKSKLGRSVVVTVRFDRPLHYLVELAARKQRRTISSYLEWAAERGLNEVRLGDGNDPGHTVGAWRNHLWDSDEMNRFLALAYKVPELLTFEEQQLWNLIRNNGYLWSGGDYESGEYKWSTNKQERIYLDRLRDNWEKFKAVAEGKADPSTLPKWSKTKKEK